MEREFNTCSRLDEPNESEYHCNRNYQLQRGQWQPPTKILDAVSVSGSTAFPQGYLDGSDPPGRGPGSGARQVFTHWPLPSRGRSRPSPPARCVPAGRAGPGATAATARGSRATHL